MDLLGGGAGVCVVLLAGDSLFEVMGEVLGDVWVLRAISHDIGRASKALEALAFDTGIRIDGNVAFSIWEVVSYRLQARVTSAQSETRAQPICGLVGWPGRNTNVASST